MRSPLTPPPAARQTGSRPRQPAVLRRGLIGQLEPVFTTVLTLSFLAHGVATATLFQVEPPPPPTTEQVIELWRRVKPPPAVIAREPAPTPRAAPDPRQVEPASRPPPTSTPTREPRPGATPGSTPRLSAAEIADAVRQRGAAVLTQIAFAGEGGGDIADLVAIGAGDLTTDLRGRGIHVAKAGEGIQRVTGGDRAASLGEDGGDLRERLLGDRGPGRVATGTKDRADLAPVVTAEPLDSASGKIDEKKVARILKARAGAIQACYEAALKTDSKLGGKLGIEMTIDGAGRVADVAVADDQLGSPAVERCVKRELRRLRMPRPDDDGDVVVAYSFVFSAR